MIFLSSLVTSLAVLILLAIAVLTPAMVRTFNLGTVPDEDLK